MGAFSAEGGVPMADAGGESLGAGGAVVGLS